MSSDPKLAALAERWADAAPSEFGNAQSYLTSTAGRSWRIGVAEIGQRAREMGGDAIVDFSFGEQTAYVMNDGRSTSMQTRTTPVTAPRASGTVVRFTDRACAEDAPRATG